VRVLPTGTDKHEHEHVHVHVEHGAVVHGAPTMPLRRRAATLFIALLALGASAFGARAAAPAADQPVTILGLTEDGSRLYLVRGAIGTPGAPPRALYFRLDRPPGRRAPDSPSEIRSWHAGSDAAEIEARVARKIAYLGRHLRPLERAPLEGLELGLRHGPLLPCPVQAGEPDAAARDAALAQARAADQAGRYEVDGAPVAVCREVAATVRWEGREVRTTVLTWGDVRVVSAWRFPGSPRGLLILRHRGVTLDEGYTMDVAILVDAG
jgi:hypothetical protein